MQDLTQIIRTIPDFPEPGILFRDITPILHDPIYLKAAVDKMADMLKGIDFDYIAGPESRGFIFGVPLAYNLAKGFIPIRKEGKLPCDTLKKSYSLEYGTATIEMHADAITKGSKVVIADDLLATGGTSKAIVELIEEAGGEVVSMIFLIELISLKARDLFEGYSVHSALRY